MRHFGKVDFPKNIFALPRSVKIISLIMFVYYFGWGISEPFMPLYFKKILGNYFLVGLAVAFLHFFHIFWSLILAALEDTFYKKRFLIFTLFLYLPMSSIILTLKSFSHFIFFRFYHSFTASSLWINSETYTRQHSPKDKVSESIGLYTSSWGLSLILGAVLSGFLFIRFGFSIFYAISLFACLSLIVAFFLPDRNNQGGRGASLKQKFKDFLANKLFLKASLYLAFSYFCTAFAQMILPLFLVHYGANFILVGLIVAIFNLPIIFEVLFSTFENKKKLVIFALGVGALSLLLMALTKNIILIFIFAFILALSFSAIHPILSGQLTNLMPKREIGEFTGILYALNSLFFGLSFSLAGLIAHFWGLNYVFLLGFFGFLILLVIGLKSKTILANL